MYVLVINAGQHLFIGVTEIPGAVRRLCIFLNIYGLVGCSPWSCWESDTTERLHFHFSLSCIGEGNGNPLQCSCLENPKDGVPGGLLSMGLQTVRHDWSDLAAAAACLPEIPIFNSYRVKVKSLSRVRLCEPMDCSLPGSTFHEIFQARILEWVAMLSISGY